jgi:hypothetical protein
LFKHARVKIQDQYMDFNDFNMKAQLDAILNVKHGNTERWLSQLYTEQTGVDGGKYSSVPAHEKPNRLSSALIGIVKNSRKFQMRGKPPVDFCDIDKYMLSRVPISFEFIFNSPDNYLRSANESATYKFVMSECKLYVPTIKVRADIELANAETLKHQPALYPCTRSMLKTYTISKGNHSFEKENIFQDLIPMQTIVCMVSSANYSPGYKNNPFYFQSFKLNNISLTVDDVRHSLNMKFASDNNQVVQPYLALMHMFPFMEISVDEYATDLPFFAFDTRSSSDNNSLPMIRKGFTGLQMKFDDALTENITVFVYSKFARVIQISDVRTVTL